MYFYGSFLTQLGETVTVHIVTENSRARQVEIGSENSGMYFTTNPVEIESSVNDTFDHLLRNRAAIRLLTRDFIKDLFCTTCMDAVVNIFKGDKCIFAGFIEPQTYSQGYNEIYDELEINCIDVLSALQYSKYRNIGSLGVLYDDIKSGADMRTFHDILSEILCGACQNIDVTGKNSLKCYYDGSKSMTAVVDKYLIFKQIAVSELLFLKDEEDDVWQQDKILDEILRYLNLHIIQEGLNFYIFSWETIKSGSAIDWQDLLSGTIMTTERPIVEIALGNAAGTDTNISIGEVFNQILLTCNTQSVDKLIESPLDSADLVSPYSNRQKYMTEYSCDGEGEQAYTAFYNMTHGLATAYGGAVATDWYIQIKNNPKWIFPETGTGMNLIDKWCHNNTNQELLLNRCLSVIPGAALISFGKIEHTSDRKNNAPISKIEMPDYMVISVNGNRKTDSQTAYPNSESLVANAPLAIYNGNVAGGVYSPSDEDTTNYIVLSGKLALNPVMDFTQNYKTLHDATSWDSPSPEVWHKTVPSRNNGDGRYYTQQYFKAQTPAAGETWDENVMRGLVPFTNTGPQEFEFKRSSPTDATDSISKIPVLACMLIIGNKCLVETGKDGQITDFKWVGYKKREQCANDEEYYKQSFTIGFDPKIGDKLIGTEFDIQNNIDYTLGIDAEGIAIPIKKDDKLNGKVAFMILGPVNLTWNEYPRWNPIFNLGMGTGVPLMAFVSSIFIKQFEIKIYSNNGLINNLDGDDIVYMSDTCETYVNRKDDIKFEICSALTLSECKQLGVADTISLSTALNVDTSSGILDIYDRNKQQYAKPEQSYVDSYYTEYHKPRVTMVQKIDDHMNLAEFFNHYVHPALDKEFYVQGISRNLIEGYAEITMKEVWDD